MITQYYAAFGSNLSHDQMKCRCPAAKPLTSSFIPDYTLAFKSVANIIASPQNKVPVGVYSITEACETALDCFESYPNLYTKKYLKLKLFDDQVLVMTYVMKKKYGFGNPSDAYYRVIGEGYIDWGIDDTFLTEARDYAIKNEDGTAFRSKRWDGNAYK